MEYYVCPLEELTERKSYVVQINEIEIGFILEKGKVYSFENKCPHMEGPVCLGDVKGKVKLRLDENKVDCGEYVSQQMNLICPWHGIEFDIESGTCLVEPHFRLNSFQTVIRDGDVYVIMN